MYNRNSGKQLFASMMAKVNETYKLVKELVGPKMQKCEISASLTRYRRLLRK